jgi:hypothetical protein
MADFEPIFTKLTLTQQSFVQILELQENTTQGLVVDARLHTDQNTDGRNGLHLSVLFLLRK